MATGPDSELGRIQSLLSSEGRPATPLERQLDALGRHSSQPQVRTTVVNALQDQQSPLMQVALIDQLVEWHEREAASNLEKLRQSPNVNPTVRQHADWAIGKLN